MNYFLDNNIACTIRKKNIDLKVAFVKAVISSVDIPTHFKPLKNFNTEKIFFSIINNNQKQKREWLFFNDNMFFCAYCICFSNNENNRLVEGVEYKVGCRISEILSRHELETQHIRSKNVFGGYLVDGGQESEHISEKRQALKSVVKIIIFITIHSRFLAKIDCKYVL